MLPEMEQSCFDMITKWDDLVSAEGSCDIDVWSFLKRFTADVISRTAFSSRYKEGKRIFELIHQQTELTTQIFNTVSFPGKRFLPTTMNKTRMQGDNQTRNLLKDIIAKSEKSMKAGDNTGRDDLFGILSESNHKQIQQHVDNKKVGMSINDVIEDCKLFYFAGHETTSVLLVWTLLLLAKHQDLNYDVRDRACFLTKLPFFNIVSHELEKAINCLPRNNDTPFVLIEYLFGRQVKPVLAEPSNYRFYLPRSLSQIVLHAAPGYEPLLKPCRLVDDDLSQFSEANTDHGSNGIDDTATLSGSFEGSSDYDSECSTANSSRTLEAALGVGFTGSLASIPQKRGDYRFHLSTRTSERLWSSPVTLSKGLRSREEEDSVSSHVLIQAIANACKVPGEFSSGLTETEVSEVHAMKFSEGQELEQLINGQICYKVYPFSAAMHKTVEERKIMLPGSFNPLHDGHLKLLEVAARICGNGYPCFELSAIKTDKPPLSVLEIKNRVKQFEAVGKTIIISSQPYFYKKAELFPGSAFVIGVDTAARIISPKYYDGNNRQMLEVLSGCNRTRCTFVVGGRNIDGNLCMVLVLVLHAFCYKV